MRYILAIILSVWASSAFAQAPTRLCFSLVSGSTQNCVPVDAGNPLPVTSSGGGSVTQGTVPWIISGLGIAGTADTGVVTIQGIASSTPVGVSASSGAFASGAFAVGSGVDGWDVTLGTTTQTQCASATTSGCSLQQRIMRLDTDIVAGTIGTSSLTPGTAPAAAIVTACQYNSSSPAPTTTQTLALQCGPKGGLLLGGAGYPAGATPITISTTGTTGATTATLATGASITTYLCGFSIRANASAAATANSTVTGTITGTLNYTQWTAPNTSGIGLTEQIFTPCIPASAVNTGIAVISAAPGTGGVVSVTAWGFTL